MDYTPITLCRVSGLLQAKSLLNAVYFAGDHVVWASQAGIYSNKEVIDRAQKISLWAWFGASTCTIVNELTELANMRRTRVLLPGEVRGAASKALSQLPFGRARSSASLVSFHVCI